LGKNIEIKARTSKHDFIRQILQKHEANFIGTDHQIDHYYKVAKGRLKLRLGTIEKSLIYYDRPNTLEAKVSNYFLFKRDKLDDLHPVLSEALGGLVTVDKMREIYFIQNAKIHLDKVASLGEFVEIEIIDEVERDPKFSTLLEQCNYYQQSFGIEPSALIDRSYSDLLLELNS